MDVRLYSLVQSERWTLQGGHTVQVVFIIVMFFSCGLFLNCVVLETCSCLHLNCGCFLDVLSTCRCRHCEPWAHFCLGCLPVHNSMSLHCLDVWDETSMMYVPYVSSPVDNLLLSGVEHGRDSLQTSHGRFQNVNIDTRNVGLMMARGMWPSNPKNPKRNFSSGSSMFARGLHKWRQSRRPTCNVSSPEMTPPITMSSMRLFSSIESFVWSWFKGCFNGWTRSHHLQKVLFLVTIVYVLIIFCECIVLIRVNVPHRVSGMLRNPPPYYPS